MNKITIKDFSIPFELHCRIVEELCDSSYSTYDDEYDDWFTTFCFEDNNENFAKVKDILHKLNVKMR